MRPSFVSSVHQSVTPSARATTALDSEQFALDSKAFGKLNMWKRKQNQFETSDSRVESLAAKVAQAKRKLRGLSQTPPIIGVDNYKALSVKKVKPLQAVDDRARTSLAGGRALGKKGKTDNIEIHNVDSLSRTATPARKASAGESNPSPRKKIELGRYLDR